MTKKKTTKKAAQKLLPLEVARDKGNDGDTLHTGTVYEGSVFSTGKNYFVVSIDQRFQVLVYRERFAPSAKFPEVPVTCFVGRQDKVKLTVIPKTNTPNCSEEWEAVKCWPVDGVDSASGKPIHRLFMSADVVHVTSSELQLGQHPNTVIARSDSIELFGYRVNNVDLALLFKTGDKMKFEPTSVTNSQNTVTSVGCAWFGSYRLNEKKVPTSEQRARCLEFCMEREVPKETLVTLMVAGDLNQSRKEEDASSDEEFVVNYIQPSKQPPIMTHMQQNDYQELMKNSSKLPSLSHPPPELHQPQESRIESWHLRDENTVETSSLNSPATADASTQTYSTGDVACFFDVVHDA